MSLDIIIVTFNNRDLLKRTLPLVVAEAERCEASVTIVDNHSRDGTVDLVAKRYPEIKLISLGENVGFAKANNIGLAGSSSDYTMFLNPDVIVPLGSIAELVGWAREHRDVGIVGPRLLNIDGSLQYSCRRFPTPMTYVFELLRLDRRFPTSKLFGRYLMTDTDHGKTMDVDYVCGAAMLVSSECLRKIGCFDEGFFMYAEEAELCWRARRGGYRVVYWPMVSMIHLGGESTRVFKKEMYSELIRSRWRFFLRTGGLLPALSYLLIAIGYSLATGKRLCSKLWRI